MKKKTALTFLTLILTAGLIGCGSSKESDGPTATIGDVPDEVSAGAEPVEAYVPELPTENVNSDIFVTKIDGISDDFIRGIDISSLLAEEASGVKYYDESGNEADLLKILADAGVNYIRLRVWVDPYDGEGHGYGGGNCDVGTACEIGKRAAAYGLKTCIDFHYSDFWADPNKQMAPKAWNKMETATKLETIKSYTIESLNAILDAGADIGMVQVGNETNNGIAGIKGSDNLYKAIASGCEGVREVSKERGLDIKVAVHFTQIDNHDDTLSKAERLKEAGADYDIFGVSYYMYWHGSLDNMKSVLTDIHDEYGVDTCIMETSYPYTSEDGDGSGNSISGEDEPVEGYPVSVQGQAKNLRDIMAAANEAGALGVFYWEGAWIPVGDNYEENQKKWEDLGSGWASSYAGSYDPNDAGKYYGGCSWENQALFDFTGHPLSSLNVFKYVKYGATAPIEVLELKKTEIESPLGEELKLPDTVEAVYNDSDLTAGVPVTWKEDLVNAIDVNKPGKYTIDGHAEFDGEGVSHNAVLIVKIAAVNYIENGSFEDDDVSMWEVTYADVRDQTDIQDKASDAMSGSRAFHFWSASPVEFYVQQNISADKLHPGSYTATALVQGGDMGDEQEVRIYVIYGGDVMVSGDSIELTGWQQWKELSIPITITDDMNEDIQVGIYVKGAAGGWGTIDDVELFAN